MKSTVLPLLAAVLLASCAPTTMNGLSGQGPSGRIVNGKTGQEGRVSFVGGFQDRASLPSDPDNVTVTVGGTVYSGRYTVLGGAAPLGVSVGIGGSLSSGSGNAGSVGGLFGGVGFGAPHRAQGSVTRPGNLIARTTPSAGAALQTLTCTFEVDNRQHGIGSCQDSAGASYSLQF